MVHRIAARMYLMGSIATLLGCLLFYYLVPRVFTGNTGLDNVFLASVMAAVAGGFLFRRKQHLQASHAGNARMKQMATKSCLDYLPPQALLREARPMMKGLPRAPQKYSLRLVYSRPLSQIELRPGFRR